MDYDEDVDDVDGGADCGYLACEVDKEMTALNAQLRKIIADKRNIKVDFYFYIIIMSLLG